jgi:hypothetical protein
MHKCISNCQHDTGLYTQEMHQDNVGQRTMKSGMLEAASATKVTFIF